MTAIEKISTVIEACEEIMEAEMAALSPKEAALLAIMEEKHSESDAVTCAAVLHTIMIDPSIMEFFAPVETVQLIEAVEESLESLKAPDPKILMQIFHSLPDVFDSLCTPPSKLVHAFEEVID